MSKITYADKEYIYKNDSIPEINKITDGNMNEIKRVVNANDDRLTTVETGWVSSNETWTYASVDDPTGVITISGDKTTKYSLGMRIKFTNGGNTIFGIITKISYSSINTTLTFLHEINPSTSTALHLMANSAITNNYYSNMKVPYGFPMDSDKWTLTFTPDTSTTINNPVSGTWYNLNTFAIPIGKWEVSYVIGMYPSRKTSGEFGQKLTISTTANSETNALLSSFIYFSGGISAIIQSTMTNQIITTTVQTNYYLNIKTDYTGLMFIRLWGIPTPRVKFTCAYL